MHCMFQMGFTQSSSVVCFFKAREHQSHRCPCQVFVNIRPKKLSNLLKEHIAESRQRQRTKNQIPASLSFQLKC